MISYKEFTSRWSELHGGAEIQGAVAVWLRISYVVVRPLAALRFTPNTLTVLGLLAAASMMWAEYLYQVLLLLLFSLICDGLDGSLAIYRNKVTRLGGLYDSVADRISEAFWLISTTWMGVPAGWAIAIWIIAATQEYARARLSSLGYSEVGVVTPTERPVRAIFVAAVIFLYLFDSPYIVATAIGFVTLQLISLAMVMKMARSIIK
jgi:CDP-diacylglycerol--glycerol-3-phosphate 3-phosphatidyltransferase